MGCIDRYFKKFMKLPKSIIVLHISAKFVIGLGIGAVLAVYLSQYDWQTIGFVLIVLAILMSIPAAYKLFGK